MNPMERFPKLAQPMIDMGAVRSRQRTGVLYVDVDLSTARSLAAGTALVLPIAGTILYIDQKQNTGYATVHLVDETFSAGNTPITVYSGYILRAPFTQLVLENVSQTGMTLRILYGVDIDFVPGSGAGVVVTNPVNVLDVLDPSVQVATGAPGNAVGSAVATVVLPANNPRGIRMRQITQQITAGAGGDILQQVIARPTAPAGPGSSNPGAQLAMLFNNTTSAVQFQTSLNREIPAGWGLYVTSTINVAVAATNSAYLCFEIK